MKYINYTEIYNKYKDKWIAFRSEDSTEVAGSGKTLEEAVREAKKKGFSNPVVTKLPSFKYTYAL
jgi:hypothetical protein